MKYLIDTHVFLWSFSKPGELSRKATSALKNEDNEIFISTVSLWEISIKVRIGKLELKGIHVKDLPGIIDKMDYQIIDLEADDAIRYSMLKENTHNDPFDRMLIQQSINRNMVMLSKDKEFKKFVPYGLRVIW
jgi:PIN domain nuclease of toxin-antitoxin system